MSSVARDFGSFVEITTYDPTGAGESWLEIEYQDDATEALEAAGFELLGEWDKSEVDVQEM